MTTKPDKKSQIQKFKEAALELEADESEKPLTGQDRPPAPSARKKTSK